MPEDSARDLIQSIEPQSILPPEFKERQGRDILSALFSSREKVYFVGDRVPAWWSPERDKWLWQTTLSSDVLAGAIYSTSARLSSIPVNIRARDLSNRNNRRLANWSHLMLEHYWTDIAFSAALDWQTQDNGCFIEVIGGGDPAGQIEPTKVPGTNDYVYATGLRMLDSQYATRTKDPEYPVVYQHIGYDGVERFYKFHRSRIIYMSQMPNSRRDMLGVGLCGASRCVRNVLHLDDINLLMDEILGARPISQIVFGKAISAEDLEDAFTRADEKMILQSSMSASEARKRSARTVFISAEGAPEMVRAADISTMELKKLPEGFSPEVEMNLAVNVVSMGLGFDPREIWPATVRGATRADAEVQHWKAMMKTPGMWVRAFTRQLNEKWAPNTCYTDFDQQDDEQDRARAEIRQIRADTLATRIESGAIDSETAFQMMLADGDITESQYLALQRSEELRLRAEALRQSMLPPAGSGGADATQDSVNDSSSEEEKSRNGRSFERFGSEEFVRLHSGGRNGVSHRG